MTHQKEKTQPGIYHIHLDTKTQSTKLHDCFQRELGFFPHHFSGHPEGRIHFEPTSHSSKKILSKDEFRKLWEKAVRLVGKDTSAVGYLEGEYIPKDIFIPYRPITTFFTPSFSIKRRTLYSSQGEKFRETELHLVLDFDKSDQRVITGLLDAGLYGALRPKQGYRVIVLTIQGHACFIRPLIEKIQHYLSAVGGVVHCTLKEEVALKHHLFGGMTPEELPEIIETITYV
jgi:hypothetical protein